MKALPYFFLMIFPFFVFANRNENNGAIKGFVLTSDRLPASSVSLVIKNKEQGTTTDDNGNFEFQKLKPAVYILHVSLLGYNDSDITVQVNANETVFLKIQLHQTYAELKQVIVEANASSQYVETKTSASLRLNVPLIEVPQNIQVTTAKLLADQGLVSMTEAIRTVSGVVKTEGSLNDYILIIRGTDANWNIFRNGVGGYSWNQQEDAAMLEKIEFIKGPAGFMVSYAQPGGIINNVTKQPVKEPVANIDAGFGSYNLMRITADLGGSLSKSSKFSYRFNTGIHLQNRAFQFSNASRYFICAAIKYEPGKKTSITAEYNYMRGNTFGNNENLPSVNGKMFALPANFTAADANTDRLTATDNYFRIQLKNDFNYNWHLNTQIAYIRGTWGGYMLDADINVPVSNDTLYRAANFDDWREFSYVTQAYIDGKFYTGQKIEHKVLLGVDYCYAGFTEAVGGTWGEQKFGIYLPHPQYYVNADSLRDFPIALQTKLHWGWSSLYIQDQVKFGKKLLVSAASHFTYAPLLYEDPDVPDYQKKTHHNAIIPRVGITWLFSDNFSVYALYDQCFWTQQGPNIQHKPFLPLTGYDVETGMKSYLFKRKLSLNLSLYDIVKNNVVDADPQHPGYYMQTGQVTSKGIDFDMSGNVTTSFIVNANYEYADAKVTRDTDSTMVGIKNFGTPAHVANLWLKYILQHHKLKGLAFAMGYQYMGDRSAVITYDPDPNTRFSPAYNLLDAAISYSNERFHIGLNMYNITNVNYASTEFFNVDTNEWRYTPGEPINFRLSFGVSLLNHKKLRT